MEAVKITMIMTNISMPVIHPRRRPDSRFRQIAGAAAVHQCGEESGGQPVHVRKKTQLRSPARPS